MLLVLFSYRNANKSDTPVSGWVLLALLLSLSEILMKNKHKP